MAVCNYVAYCPHNFAAKINKTGRVMDHSKELIKLGERFPNKNVGCGNPDAKILVVTQKEGNEVVDFEYLAELFSELPDVQGEKVDVLEHCYYVRLLLSLFRHNKSGKLTHDGRNALWCGH